MRIALFAIGVLLAGRFSSYPLRIREPSMLLGTYQERGLLFNVKGQSADDKVITLATELRKYQPEYEPLPYGTALWG